MVTNLKFSDISTHWAQAFIQGLAERNIISGFPDGTFRPNQPITRAQVAAILIKAFPKTGKRTYLRFSDVPATHWAAPAIQKAYETEFLSGYPDQLFRPEESITKVQVLVSLVSGLGISSAAGSNLTEQLKSFYQDAAEIPDYALAKVLTATKSTLIVNYPNLKLLQPNKTATRAEVAAFIYQALTDLGTVSKILSPYIVLPVKTVQVAHRRELRGVWITTIWNRDWPSKPGLPAQQQQTELINLLNRLQSLNFNAVFLQVRPEGDTIYPSQLEPWSYWLTGTQGKPPEPYYDPLEFAITECHKRNIELHAWFNPYRAKSVINNLPNAHPHVTLTHPEYVYKYGNQLWMDPGAKVLQDLTYNVILDVVRRYDIDGIHIDDYFYPYPLANTIFHDEKTYAAYQKNGGKFSLSDWRRDNINQMVQRLNTGIHSLKPHVKFGISPFGIYRPGQPAGIIGLDQYEHLYMDAKKWLEQGWIDYLAPQLYWRIDPPAQSYPALLKWWVNHNPKHKHLYIGNTLERIDGKTWTLQETQRQIDLTRSYESQFSLGTIFYSMRPLAENRHSIVDHFKTVTYPEPALVPVMSHLDPTPPIIPINIKLTNQQLTWSAAIPSEIRSWTLYQQTSNRWKLLKILPKATTSLSLQPGNYALCSVDQTGNESPGVSITL